VVQMEKALTDSAVKLGDGSLVRLDALGAYKLLREQQALATNGPLSRTTVQ
jgi:hypothetical protein